MAEPPRKRAKRKNYYNLEDEKADLKSFGPFATRIIDDIKGIPGSYPMIDPQAQAGTQIPWSDCVFARLKSKETSMEAEQAKLRHCLRFYNTLVVTVVLKSFAAAYNRSQNRKDKRNSRARNKASTSHDAQAQDQSSPSPSTDQAVMADLASLLGGTAPSGPGSGGQADQGLERVGLLHPAVRAPTAGRHCNLSLFGATTPSGPGSGGQAAQAEDQPTVEESDLDGSDDFESDVSSLRAHDNPSATTPLHPPLSDQDNDATRAQGYIDKRNYSSPLEFGAAPCNPPSPDHDTAVPPYRPKLPPGR
ncbi:uncharacterized protein MONBRDRAFT_39251 [Monosiga brevicollis MX1]|uniref:Uncharacterized protein n=1 Tax=Monosiga brevicollis TaxID=81824 RepID=A9VD88_MONBE|nr:uncharacterized protein MONBRDRAFT_39251 [Monosiga brevicollis MX1]EDQ84486.1 predicted protein [Monosiga brevicollis MX1]|eukprot:XP_001750673.1 hypothetical protein [Monosiga brevicollis MX1]